MTTKLFLALRSDLAALGASPDVPVVTIRVMSIEHWTPDDACWVVCGVDPGDAAPIGPETPGSDFH